MWLTVSNGFLKSKSRTPSKSPESMLWNQELVVLDNEVLAKWSFPAPDRWVESWGIAIWKKKNQFSCGCFKIAKIRRIGNFYLRWSSGIFAASVNTFQVARQTVPHGWWHDRKNRSDMFQRFVSAYYWRWGQAFKDNREHEMRLSGAVGVVWWRPWSLSAMTFAFSRQIT